MDAIQANRSKRNGEETRGDHHYHLRKTGFSVRPTAGQRSLRFRARCLMFRVVWIQLYQIAVDASNFSIPKTGVLLERNSCTRR